MNVTQLSAKREDKTSLSSVKYLIYECVMQAFWFDLEILRSCENIYSSTEFILCIGLMMFGQYRIFFLKKTEKKKNIKNNK